MVAKIYTGIGSRETPKEVERIMESIAVTLAKKGLILRSGAADGADSAFEKGASKGGGRKEIYLPWKGFNNHNSALYHVSDEAMSLAATLHPNFINCSQGAQKLHARNCYQILGYQLDLPTDLVICWTPDGLEDGLKRTQYSGGTGQAIHLATINGIPVFNLKNDNAIPRLEKMLKVKFDLPAVQMPIRKGPKNII